MNELIKELREWAEYSGLKNEPEIEDMENAYARFEAILSRHSKDTEPLAVLADRLGFWQVVFKEYGVRDKRISICSRVGNNVYEFTDKTYAAAEAKARQYLNGLPDKSDREAK